LFSHISEDALFNLKRNKFVHHEGNKEIDTKTS
jgi:hypothetical protein